MPRQELDAESRALILLGMVPGIGSTLLTKLVAYFGSATACLKASDRALVEAGLSPRVATAVCRAAQAGLNPQEETLLVKHGVGIVQRNDSDYPPLLRHIFDPPPLLYVNGTIQPSDSFAVAMVGSRKASDKGRMRAFELARDLAANGVTVVSGFALGIDTAAHQGVLDAGGRTLAVLGCGLAHLYPTQNAKLAERVADSGALLSELPMTVPPISGNFPRRNRLISGLALATVVVEAPLGSGSLITADSALEQGRELFAVPWEEVASHNTGTTRLIEEGATPVTDATQILAVLRQMPKPADVAPTANAHLTVRKVHPREKPKTVGKEIPQPMAQVAEPAPALEGNEAAVWQALTTEPTHIDALVHLTGLSVGAVSSALIFLEMKSLARQFPGKRFSRKS